MEIPVMFKDSLCFLHIYIQGPFRHPEQGSVNSRHPTNIWQWECSVVQESPVNWNEALAWGNMPFLCSPK